MTFTGDAVCHAAEALEVVTGAMASTFTGPKLRVTVQLPDRSRARMLKYQVPSASAAV